MISLKTISKIDGYYSDVKKTKDSIPYSRLHAKISAIASYLIWGTSFSEYFGYQFWKRNHKEKKTYMTRRYMFDFFDRYNPKEYRNRIGDKSVAPKYYGKFLLREQIEKKAGYEAFSEFCKKYRKVFIKKKIGWGGEGAAVAEVDSDNTVAEIWNSLSDAFVVEPLIENCDEIKSLHPASLNTIKFTVLMVNNSPEIQYALFRIGNGTQVDNVHLGGMGCGVNIKDGIVETPAYDKQFFPHTVHPVTKKQLIGFKIPQWEKTKKFVLEAAMVTPQLRYTSWDVAVTPNGPVLLEGNWDAEFYAEQMIYNCGNRERFTDKLER